MNSITPLDSTVGAAHAYMTTDYVRRLVAILLTLAGMLLSPAIMANEPPEETSQLALNETSDLAINTWSGNYLDGQVLRPRSRLLDPEDKSKRTQEAKIQAQTKYLAEKFRQQEATVRKYVELAWKEAERRKGLTPELLIAIMQKESSLRPKVQSRYGAQGLLQVVPRWHAEKLRPSESLFDPEVNIRVGAHVLEEYLEDAKGSLNEALRKYSGNARGYAKTVLKESSKLARMGDKAVQQLASNEQG